MEGHQARFIETYDDNSSNTIRSEDVRDDVEDPASKCSSKVLSFLTSPQSINRPFVGNDCRIASLTLRSCIASKDRAIWPSTASRPSISLRNALNSVDAIDILDTSDEKDVFRILASVPSKCVTENPAYPCGIVRLQSIHARQSH